MFQSCPRMDVLCDAGPTEPAVGLSDLQVQGPEQDILCGLVCSDTLCGCNLHILAA